MFISPMHSAKDLRPRGQGGHMAKLIFVIIALLTLLGCAPKQRLPSSMPPGDASCAQLYAAQAVPPNCSCQDRQVWDRWGWVTTRGELTCKAIPPPQAYVPAPPRRDFEQEARDDLARYLARTDAEQARMRAEAERIAAAARAPAPRAVAPAQTAPAPPSAPAQTATPVPPPPTPAKVRTEKEVLLDLAEIRQAQAQLACGSAGSGSGAEVLGRATACSRLEWRKRSLEAELRDLRR
jgi:hypothetical protein